LAILTVSSLIALAVLSSPAIQSHSLVWPMFHGNPQHTGLSPFNGPSAPSLEWKFQTRGPLYSAPAVGSGRIYVGSDDGNLYALNLQGHLLWKFQTSTPIRTTPAISSDGTIYLASTVISSSGDPEGILYAINPSGKLNWNLTLVNFQGYDTLSSPTIGPDGTIYVSDIGFRIVAVNPDGILKWELKTSGEVVDSPAVGLDGTVYVAIDDPPPATTCETALNKCLVALNPDGTIKWALSTIYYPVDAFSSPAVGSDGTIYAGGMTAFNPDGTAKWQYSGPEGSPSIGPDGTIYSSGDAGLYAMNQNGTLRWKFSTGASGDAFGFGQSSAVIGNDGTIYFASGTARLVSCCFTFSYGPGNLYALRPDGSLSWNFTTGPIAASEFTRMDLLAIGSDATIYLASEDGNLYAIG